MSTPETPAAKTKRREKWKLTDIKIQKRYGEIVPVRDGEQVRELGFYAEPTDEDVAEAIASKALEERVYSGEAQDALYADFRKTAAGDLNAYRRLIQQYHARRVAFFVVNGWNDPIGLSVDGILHDGGHRFRAAKFLGKVEVEVEIG